MSKASPFGSNSLPGLDARPRRAIETPMRFAGFWTAILSPFVLLGLIASGTAVQLPGLFAALLGANLVGLVVGRNYKR